MFTGIIEATGVIESISPKQGDIQVRIKSSNLNLDDVKLGDSIATNGVCLTVVQINHDGFVADVSKETLDLTRFADYKIGQTVNLEKALTPMSRLGGHLVSGHVDGIATLTRINDNARAKDYWFEVPTTLIKYIPYKGSVCIDGISLTVNEVTDNQFKLTIVPHTAEQTTIKEFKEGSQVNLEVDQLARYMEQLMNHSDKEHTQSSVSMQLLASAGFIK